MRWLFSSHPLDGHLHPLIPLARAAKAAGHSVAFAVPPEFSDKVERIGFGALACGPAWTDEPIASVYAKALELKDTRFFLSEFYADVAARSFAPPLLDIISDWRPDAIVSDPTEFGSWVAAERAGIPRVFNLWGLFIPEAFLVALAGSSLEALRASFDLPPDPALETLVRATKLLFGPRGYQAPGLEIPQSVHFFRPDTFDQTGDERLPGWVSDLPERPTVYVTLGTLFNTNPGLLETILEGLTGEDLNAVVTIGRDRDPAQLTRFGPNLHIERYIPQSLLLPHCDAVISHAGYGTLMGSLSHGLPSVLIPISADQPMHASRCAEIGSSVSLDRNELTPEAVRDATWRVLREPGFRIGAQALADEIAAMPGPDAAVELIESVVREGR
ncbi:MAG: glycosyltransferase family 1 protein [Deltaproteobacteria bacterium]|jgi:UDP:flavonoid glycosyltransferase YjiC (YdhE family)|nr:glycosyltransferase family 1 protein [Deltaproteobacteria bacterium]